MNLEEQLEALIDFSPSHIRRHFACDCAERALKRGGVADQILWEAVEVSRRYADGKATFEAPRAARAAALAAALAAAWAAERAAALAAERAAALAAAWAAERVWQIAHLQSLIATHNATRSSLLLVLQQRAESIKPILTQYAQSLEERAFE